MSAAHSAGNSNSGTDPVLEPFIEWSQSIRWDAVPEATRTVIRRELLDYLGGAIAGRAVVGMPAWLKVLVDMKGLKEAMVVGGPAVPSPLAALCNGYFGHVLEFDDTHDAATLHAGSAPIPAALAAAGRIGKLSGSRLCESVLLGIELTCRLGVATRLNLIEGGWIYGALLGHFGATLSAAHLLDNRPPAMRNAFGIAYCLVCGNHQSTRESAPTKHVQPGFAASNGLTASLMGSAGLDGVKQPISGEDGLARVYLHTLFDTAVAVENLGSHFQTERLSFKPYPTCRFTHPGISAALKLRQKLGERMDQIERLDLIVGPQAHDIVGRADPDRLTPATRMHAQFSIQWAVANALLHGELTPRQLVVEVPPADDTRALIARIDCQVNTHATDRDIGGCILRAHGPFGTVEVQDLHAKGHPDNPLSDAELLEKFTANVRLAGFSSRGAKALAKDILDIDALPDVSPLLARLGRPQRGSQAGGSGTSSSAPAATGASTSGIPAVA